MRRVSVVFVNLKGLSFQRKSDKKNYTSDGEELTSSAPVAENLADKITESISLDDKMRRISTSSGSGAETPRLFHRTPSTLKERKVRVYCLSSSIYIVNGID